MLSKKSNELDLFFGGDRINAEREFERLHRSLVLAGLQRAFMPENIEGSGIGISEELKMIERVALVRLVSASSYLFPI